MQKLFVENAGGELIYLNEEQSRHVARSLRMKKGDMITVCSGDGRDFGCMIEDENKNGVVLRVCYEQASAGEAGVRVTLFQAVPKGDKLDDVIQKCTELGVHKIVPVLTQRCVSRPNPEQAQKKLLRCNKIALEAAQQSGRGAVPAVEPMITLEEAARFSSAQVKLLFYEGGGSPLPSLIEKGAKSVDIFIGPEGGFAPEEVELLTSAGARRATLGPRILRTQTAPVAALACVMLLTGNLE